MDLPKNALVVITGPSGSGKSSLAFDTLFAEGQRRYVQSLSAYARQFLDHMHKPEVDSIEGLCPAIAIEQRSSAPSPRSTVGTTTELYDFLRLLFAAVGTPHHPRTGKPLRRWTVQEIVDQLMTEPAGHRFAILAPVARNQPGPLTHVLERLKREGFVRARINGVIDMLEPGPKLARDQSHTIEAVVDRLTSGDLSRGRLTESVETALRVGHGVLHVAWLDRSGKVQAEWTRSHENYDPETGDHFPTLTPRHFSFNSPLGACPHCQGLGTEMLADPDLMVPDHGLSLAEHALRPWKPRTVKTTGDGREEVYPQILEALAEFAGVSMDQPWRTLPEAFRHLILYGSGKETIPLPGPEGRKRRPFQGAVAWLQNLYDSSESPKTRARLDPFMTRQPCRHCGGRRLRPEVLAVRLTQPGGPPRNIHEFCELTVEEALADLERRAWSKSETAVVGEVLREIMARLRFMLDVGLGYLTLNRETHTLSGGEAQRIRLATQIGSGLTGVLYVLDEPSIGLHQRDNGKLLATLRRLRDQGNSVVVVEHDEETIRAADFVVDLGPGAGERGGQIVAQGTPTELVTMPGSVTGPFLLPSGAIPVPKRRKEPTGAWLRVVGARANNLRSVTVGFPVGLFTVVTGVSGSGKSTLVKDILAKALSRSLHGSKEKPGLHDRIEGLDFFDKVIEIDQSPLGRTPRSNALTYTGAFNGIRDLFAQLPASRIRGYTSSRFSFNTPGGRCEHCQGDGVRKVEMHFLPDVYVPCEVCKGKRFNRETLEITYKGHSIADVLELTVDAALPLFRHVAGVGEKLAMLSRVGLGYLRLGQPATTLSGGEAQRIKLAHELGRRATGRTCFILDEPTTGLHFVDIEQLLPILFELRNQGNTVIVIEHQIDVIKSADYVIDLGPNGGSEGGTVVVVGTPETVARHPTSRTAPYLRQP
ncbi:MAG: excinuclease ABC subunit UvrA [Candidatus Methylacidiphilales bacterium]